MWDIRWDPGIEKGYQVKNRGNINKIQALVNYMST